MDKSDAELMALVASGDDEMLGELYSRHGRLVWAMVRRRFPRLPMDDIDDMVQEVFIELGRSAAGYKEQSKFKAWMLTIAYRKAKNYSRQEGLQRSLGLLGEAVRSDDVMDDTNPADTSLGMKQVLNQMMDKLPDELREVVWLKVSCGYVSREIAEITGVKENTVRTRFHRARRLLVSSANAASWRNVLNGGQR